MANSSGRIEGNVHRYRVRVYYEDTDASGVVYYANYLKFSERARTELLRLLGADRSALGETAGNAWAVRRCTIDYLRPARLDDELEVGTRVLALGGASAELEQVVRLGDVDIARLDLRLAYVTPKGRPRRLPDALRATLQTLIQP